MSASGRASGGRLKRWFGQPVRWGCFLAGGVPPVLVFPAPSLSYLAWFALVPGMVLFARAPSVREAVARGWWFGAGYLIAMLYWMAPEIGPGLVLLGAVAGGLYSPFAVSVNRLLRPPLPGAPLRWRSALAAMVVVPSCWLLPEWVRSYQGLGGPWDLYGASQWQHPAVLALAAVGGVWLVSVALVMANIAIMIILITATSAERRTPPRNVAVNLWPAKSEVDGPPACSRVGRWTFGTRAAIASRAATLGAGASGGAVPGVAAASGLDAARVPESGMAGAQTTPAIPDISGFGSSGARGVGARRWGLVAFGVLALVAAGGSGPLAFALTPPSPAVRTVNVALVQPGLVSNAAAQANASETITRDMSRDDPFGGTKDLDLIVWGESSIDEDLTLPSSRPLLRSIEALSAEDGAEILVSQDATPPGEGHEKWGVLVSPSGIKGIYIKTRLVPFGEYIPFRQQLGWLTKVSKAAGTNMTPGTGAHLLHAVTRSGQPLPIGVLTCFESAFPDMSRVDADLGAQLIVYQSSTATFQGTWGPDQHASLAALRAAETGRPVVQAALTGDSVAFDARGRELTWLGQSGRGVVTVKLALPSGSARTFYDQFGDYVMWAGVGISALAAAVMFARRRGFIGGSAGASGGHAAEYEEDTGQPVAG